MLIVLEFGEEVNVRSEEFVNTSKYAELLGFIVRYPAGVKRLGMLLPPLKRRVILKKLGADVLGFTYVLTAFA